MWTMPPFDPSSSGPTPPPGPSASATLRLVDVLPGLASELEDLLRDEGERGLAAQVATLPFVARCCNEVEVCQSFSTAPGIGNRPPRPAERRTIQLDPDDGMIWVDVTDGRIVFVEVLYRDDVERALRGASKRHRLGDGCC
jgi:hypothetical protein